MPAPKKQKQTSRKKTSPKKLNTEQELRDEIHRLECVVLAQPNQVPKAPEKPRLSRHQKKLVQEKRISNFLTLVITVVFLLAVLGYIVYQARVQL